MALQKDRLLESLDQLRDTIRQEEQLKGRQVPVCSDNVLREIAKTKPLKISDFLAISGIGRVFMERYASRFLQVIMTYQQESVNEVHVSKTAFKVLDHYKDRLTNISRRNPNLYMGKIVRRRNFDMAALQLNLEIVQFLTNKRQKVLSLRFPSTIEGDQLERHITVLYRETNKDEKETGSYDLYLAYPYVEGVFKRDQFAIKAPLLYFPVKLVRKQRAFELHKVTDKDIIFNRDLLLAISKFEQNDVDSKTPFLQEVSIKAIRDIVIPYYEANGIELKKPEVSMDFIPFKRELKDQFVKRKKGVFHLLEYMTLGRYKLYSSMIQKDMSTILDQQKYNDLLEGLIDESNLYSQEKDVVFQLSSAPINEERLSYINDVNYAQEKVIDLVNTEQKLVIWGPPGTGKSQTITSLIASSVLKGQNVLVVSEKKVALDVIYSRLKNASRYTMFIDDTENKQAFYQKMQTFVSPSAPERTLNNDIYELEQQISKVLFDMDRAIELLYHESIQYVPIHKLYSRYVRDKDVLADFTPKQVHQLFASVFGDITFKQMDILEQTFDTNAHLRDYLRYETMCRDYPLLEKLETKISRSNKIDLENFTEEFRKLENQLEHVWFLKRRKLKKEFIEGHKKSILYLTKKRSIDKAYMKLLLQDDTLHNYIMTNLNKLNKLRKRHKELTPFKHKFLNMFLTHPQLMNREDPAKIRRYLFDAFYTGYLEEFKAQHQEYLYIFDKYEDKRQELDRLMEQKREITIETFDMELYKYALNLLDSKRIMDIKRSLESERKLSVKAFINQFQLELMNSIKIWMMTPETVSAILPLVYGMFDVVIFDEASQMYVEKGIPSIYRAKKVVIAGDTKQLRPSSLGIGRLEDDDEYYEEDVIKDITMDAKSLLDLARYKYYETILNYHYRSRYEELIAFSNYAFYEGKLIVSPNQQTPDKPPIEYVHVKDGVFDNRRNEEEAKAVIRLLRKVFRERTNNETIGVITFNSSQRDLIENYIDEELFKRGKYQKLFERELFRQEDGEDKSLFVKNIENVQGDERDIIIFSMGYGRDPEGIVHRRFGWLNNEGGQNRLNVAISRAKQKVYFVSSLYPEELKVEDLKSTGPKLLKNYMRYCYYISNNKPDLARDVLQQLHHTDATERSDVLSPFVEDVKARVERSGYHVKTNIGIGRYSIDLAVYDEDNNEYLLGIICDVDNNLDMTARRDLIHQEKYLRARNWDLYRVFSSNWYMDKNKEMRAIREYLK
ncbi:AAA domain-containing protein [Candidatus Xianfuyuplasma coldseepsis]|uniref:DUF4011 domain-containing protein n=1 Tax=Candidatus Xianfuyuplasma coldseepsis TaxID=2782163 RepID=A0A7L7KRS4_9MOLU|nr:AAA domain-containing protein [Xianfuyuplasma coldseepsis]QMS85407.1 DUF4011 domain-containing protein [Xianfuyuplasma coldseepsis]